MDGTTTRRGVIAILVAILLGTSGASADHLGANGETAPAYEGGDTPTPEAQTTPQPTSTETPSATPSSEPTPQGSEGEDTDTPTSSPTPESESEEDDSYPRMKIVREGCHEQQSTVSFQLVAPDHKSLWVVTDSDDGRDWRQVDTSETYSDEVRVTTTDRVDIVTDWGQTLDENGKDYSDEILRSWEAPVECVGQR